MGICNFERNRWQLDLKSQHATDWNWWRFLLEIFNWILLRCSRATHYRSLLMPLIIQIATHRRSDCRILSPAHTSSHRFRSYYLTLKQNKKRLKKNRRSNLKLRSLFRVEKKQQQRCYVQWFAWDLEIIWWFSKLMRLNNGLVFASVVQGALRSGMASSALGIFSAGLSEYILIH